MTNCLLISDLIASPEHSPKVPKNLTVLFSSYIGTTKILFRFNLSLNDVLTLLSSVDLPSYDWDLIKLFMATPQKETIPVSVFTVSCLHHEQKMNVLVFTFQVSATV